MRLAKPILVLGFFCLCFPSAGANSMIRLKISGDSVNGYTVSIYEGSKVRVIRKEEFSIQLSNLDLSVQASIPFWKGQSWSGNDQLITLKGTNYIRELDVNLDVIVRYEVVNDNIVKKTIRLFQGGMPDMYYVLKETARPPQTPVDFCSFEQDHFPGGMVHEMFPAAGWINNDSSLVGFLTDAGYRNQYTRATRRRFSGRMGGLGGLRILPDPNLIMISAGIGQMQSDPLIRFTYGEMYDLDAGQSVSLKTPAQFSSVGNTIIQQNDSIISLQYPATEFAGLRFFPGMHDQRVYTISFLCKGRLPVAVKLFRVKNGIHTVELEDGMKYIDAFPVTDSEWNFFQSSILVPYIQGDSIELFIGSQEKKTGDLQIKNLRVSENIPASKPYNLLRMGVAEEKNSFIFIEPWKSHKDFMIHAQTRLAEGKGFKGSEIEKMMYGNFNALTWITSVRDFTPFNVPNMNYMPDMYNRDCFFAAVSTYNAQLNQTLWNQWAKTQTASGSIGTIITPYMGSVEAKDNEASIEWLIWAMLNKRRFGIVPPADKIKKTVDYVLNEFDSTGNGICFSHFPLCQVDIIDFNPKTNRLAVNQGMLAIALLTIQELGYPVSDKRIQHAIEEYRNFYDPKRGHLLFDRNYPDLISLTDLEPEFFSLWLFNRPMLTDQMVISHLDKTPVLNKVPDSPHPQYGTTAPILIRLTNDKKGWAYLSKEYQPFEKFGEENYSDGKNDGFYYNGGSWFRPEYCAYVVGLKHGWTHAKALMENRVWAEINLNPQWPFSKEFIPTKYTSTASWWPSTRGLCWNVFVLMADEVAGLRTPAMDPDYQSESKKSSPSQITPFQK